MTESSCTTGSPQCAPAGRPDRTDAALMAALVVAGLAIRLYLLRFHDVISTDGTAYVNAARALSRGEIGPLGAYGLYPFLVWLLSLPGFDPESTGRFISATLGSLLVVPLYLLGSALFSRRTALAAGIAVLAWPSLLNWSCEVMTQATYAFLSLAGIYGVWKTVSGRSVPWGAAAGLLLGLAYLTRPEGLLLFLATPLPLLWTQRRAGRSLLAPVSGYAAGFTLLFVLNMVLNHQISGTWQLSAKTSAALTDALSYYLDIPDLAYIPGIKSMGYLDIIATYPEFIWRNSASNLVALWDTFAPKYLWGLALAGCIALRPGADRRGMRLFLLSTASPLFVIVVFYYIGPEYTQPYIPVFLLFAAEGLVRLERFAAGRAGMMPETLRTAWSARTPVTLAAAAVFFLTLLVGQVPARSSDAAYRPFHDEGRRDQKNIGLLLKQYLPPGKIMTRWARIAYYADREWVTIPQASFEEILRTAHANGVRYLIVDGRMADIRPDLGILTSGLESGVESDYLQIYNNPIGNSASFRLFLIHLSPSSLGVKVFELN